MLWQKNSDQSDSSDVLYVDIFECNRELKDYYFTKTSIVKRPMEKSTISNLAECLRVQGNRWFGDKLYERAMENYNRSLCYVEKGSDQMAITYNNRSACFFYLHMYNKCLIDIELAKKSKCSDRLKIKLGKRRTDCLRLIEENADDVTHFAIPKLSFEKNEKIPCMANVLDIHYTTEFGFHLVAKCDIDVGKTILVEELYSYVPVADESRCSVCGKEEPTNCIPCDACSEVMFCTEECKNKSFHNIECVNGIFYKSERGSGEQMRKTMFKFTVRTIFRAFFSFNNVNEFITFVERCIGEERKVVPTSQADESSKYEAFLKILPDKVYVRKDCCLKEIFFTFKFIMKSEGLLFSDSRWLKLELLDNSLTLILSFMNYSCTPNAVVCAVNGSKVLTSARRIKKGEKIQISRFGDHLSVYDEPLEFDELLSVVKQDQCKCDRCEKRSSSPSEREVMREDPHYRFILENYSKERYVESETERLKQNAIEFLRKFGRLI